VHICIHTGKYQKKKLFYIHTGIIYDETDFKAKSLPEVKRINSAGGSLLKFQLLGRLRSGGLWVPGQPGVGDGARPHLSRKKLGVAVCTCHPNYSGKHKL
jgi:hypothetical protein